MKRDDSTDSDREFIAGLKGAAMTIESRTAHDIDDILARSVGGVKSFSMRPAGTSPGAIEYAGKCVITSYEMNDDGTFSATMDTLKVKRRTLTRTRILLTNLRDRLRLKFRRATK